ncbi:TRAP transporter small permease [Frigidibacter sp. MR17.14]|uniref:TRAP transporter small permease subunit n=1 Tax=Frigidibacter sp. MR17.14 TaxID=3126509 RepID=UPI003013165F
METALTLGSGLRRGIEAVAKVMALAAGWAYFATAIFITIDVLARKFLGVSSGATTEISGYLLAFGISWSLAHALAERAHIRIDLLVEKLPIAARVWAHLVALLALLALIAILVWSATNVIEETLLFQARDLSALRIPMILPQGLWAFGMFMLALFAFALTLEVVLLLAAGRPMDIEALMHPRNAEDETEETIRALHDVEEDAQK